MLEVDEVDDIGMIVSVEVDYMVDEIEGHAMEVVLMLQHIEVDEVEGVDAVVII